MRYIFVIFIGFIMSLPSTVMAQQKARNTGNTRMHSASEMTIFGDFINDGLLNENLGSVYISGRTTQTVSGNQSIQLHNVILNNPNDLILNTRLGVTSSFLFTNGRVNTPRSTPSVYLRFYDNSIYINANNSKHVNGYVTKQGNDSFYFPIGNGVTLRPAAVSTPSVNTSILAAYFDRDAHTTDLPIGAPFSRVSRALNLLKVSNKEFWHIEGNVPVRLSLTWNSASKVDTLTDNDLKKLVVAGWNGTEWISLGAYSRTGTLTSGIVTSRTLTPDSFRIFTLAMQTNNLRCVTDVLALGKDTAICNNTAITFHAGNRFQTYQWSNGSTDSVLTTAIAGTYWVRVKDICGNTQTDTVRVNHITAPTLTIIPPAPICKGEVASIQVPSGFRIYSWSRSANDVVCQNCQTFNTSPNVTTRYYLTAIFGTVCSVYDSVLVTVKRSDVTNIDTMMCNGGYIRIAGRDYANTGNYRISLQNTEGCDSIINLTIRNGINVKITSSPATCYGRADGRIIVTGDTTSLRLYVNNTPQYFKSLNGLLGGAYRIQMQSLNGCRMDTTITLIEPPSIRLELGRGDSIHIPFGTYAILTAKPIGDFKPISYEWSPPNVVNCYTCQTIQTITNYRTYLTVTASDKNGCKTSASIDVLVDRKDGLYIPNAFNPDKEGYAIFGTEIVKTIHSMRIFDRWGELIFEAHDFKPDGSVRWDGTFRGKNLNTGAFVVTVEAEFITGEKKSYAKDLLLAR